MWSENAYFTHCIFPAVVFICGSDLNTVRKTYDLK